MKRIILAIGFLILQLPGIGRAADGYAVLNGVELKAMIDRKEPGLFIIDSRSPDEYQEVHIRGAINVSWVKMEADPSLISWPKDAKIVFYCNGFS